VILCAKTLAALLVVGDDEKFQDLMWRLKKFWEFCVAELTEISNPELNVTRVKSGPITAVVILKRKWPRVGNGSVISVDRRESDC
jgi:hypothetical protein